MSVAVESSVISHWDHLVEGMQYSTQDFYTALEQAIASRQIPDLKVSRVEIKEGGLLSAKRLYLRVWRKKLMFDVCGAPFGNAFFFSWWLTELPSGCLAFLLAVPVVRQFTLLFVRPWTYFKLDTAYMFQQSVHAAVMEVLDDITKAKGLRTLSEAERKPIMRDFFQR
ncbi:MAG: hypothetical protein KF886_10260 [Candidatus Hydrogenedentes bacterium]|nr:hypothetical protein [Candidatus Hydrogenedentota bacterium]